MAEEIFNLDIAYSPMAPFPDRVTLNRFSINATDQTNLKQLYLKCINAQTIVIMNDDDNIVGNCKCSNCNKHIDLFSKFCSNCGAKLTGRQIFYKDGSCDF